MENTMQYRTIPHVPVPVSPIFFGTAMMPFLAGGDGSDLLDEIFALGITAFDTARNYGGAEESLGRWIESRGVRDRIVVLSKCGHPNLLGMKRVSEKEMRKDLQKSLSLLRTDRIDIYLLHRDDPDVPVGTIVEVFNAMHAEGKIGAFGGSNWTCRRIEEANEYAYKKGLVPFAVARPNFGLADQVQDPWGGGCETISGPSHAEDRAWYEKNQMPVVAYSSLGRGLFSGKVKYAERDKASSVLDPNAMKGYACPDNFERLRRCDELAEKKGVTVAQLAMAWIYHQPLNTFAVVSTSSRERMQQNIDAVSLPLTDAEADWLDLRA